MVRQKLQVNVVDGTQISSSMCLTTIVLDSNTHGHAPKLTNSDRHPRISSRDMDSTNRHRAYIIDEVSEMESSCENTCAVLVSAFQEQGSDFTDSRSDLLSEATSQSSSITFDGYSSDATSTSSSIEEWVDGDGDDDDDGAFSSQQFKRPLRSLTNAHMPPPHDPDYDYEGEESVCGDDPNEVFCIDFGDYSLDAVREGRKRGGSCCHKQSQPLLRTEDENLKNNGENRVQNGGNYGVESVDFVMIDGEEGEDEEELTESCLNLISHLDYVMFPTVEVLEFVCGGEIEVQGLDVENEEASRWPFLKQEYCNENNKEPRGGELENRGRSWFTCGVFTRT